MIHTQKQSYSVAKSKPSSKKDYVWNIDNNNYTVRNVPYLVAGDEEVLNANVAMTVTMLRELMLEEQIPTEVDFEDFTHIKPQFA